MLIRLQNITKSYGETEPKVTAINKLDLTIDTNEQVAIMGRAESSPKSWCKLPFGICMNQVTTCRCAARSANASFLAVSRSSK
jgi:predicted ABC-type transport system involved in lysophospholipase L1 biosynthesis ATPase subunit